MIIKQTGKTPYMDKPEKKDQVNDQLIFDKGDSVEEKKKKKKKYEQNKLNEELFDLEQELDIPMKDRFYYSDEKPWGVKE